MYVRPPGPLRPPRTAPPVSRSCRADRRPGPTRQAARWLLGLLVVVFAGIGAAGTDAGKHHDEQPEQP
ncbi:MAG TPA: hypothetical protein VM367_18055, partial [Pseudonocardia sp.]|nr:hypothetical protein [Pseudonocardia sp.]